MAIKSPEATSMDLSSDRQRSRLLIYLANAGAFTTRIDGNRFILKIYPVEQHKKLADHSLSSSIKQQQGLDKFNFQSGPHGSGQLILTLFDAATPIDIQQQDRNVDIKLLGHPLAKKMIGHLNVAHLAPAITAVDAYNQAGNGIIRINMKTGHTYNAYQTENILTLNFQPITQHRGVNTSMLPLYTGKKFL